MAAGPDAHRPAANARLQSNANPTLNSYRTADNRWIQLLGLETARHYDGVVAALGLTETLAADERVAGSWPAPAANPDVLLEVWDKAFAEKTLEEWKGIFDDAGVWYQPLLRTQEVVFDPQVHAVDGITPVLEHNSENRQGDPDCTQPTRPPPYRTRLTAVLACADAVIASPIQLSSTNGIVLPTKGAPALGEHTEEIFAKYKK